MDNWVAVLIGFIIGMSATILACYFVSKEAEKIDNEWDHGLDKIMEHALAWRRRAEIAEAKLETLKEVSK